MGGTFDHGELEAGPAAGVLGTVEGDTAGCAPAAAALEGAAVDCAAPVADGCTERPQLEQKVALSGSEAPQLLQNIRPLFS
jgi:hypothetical protein